MVKAKKLKKGDLIAIIAPSSGLSHIFPHRIERAVGAIEKLGYKVKLYPSLDMWVGGKAGSIKERLKDVHDAFADSDVKAIICSIGGLSSNELIRHIDYDLVKKSPKIFCGYSDISILHYALYTQADLVTFYGPCAMGQFGEFPEPLGHSVDYFLKALTGIIGEVKPSEQWTDELLDWGQKADLARPRKLKRNSGHEWLRPGTARARIIGGCLYSILQLKGTDFDIDYTGKILFFEISEGHEFSKGTPLSYVDSQITDLKNAGVFDKILGLIIGRAYQYSDEEHDEFRKIIIRQTEDYKFPVLFNADIGHTDPIITIPLGTTVLLDSAKNTFSFEEAGVEED